MSCLSVFLMVIPAACFLTTGSILRTWPQTPTPTRSHRFHLPLTTRPLAVFSKPLALSLASRFFCAAASATSTIVIFRGLALPVPPAGTFLVFRGFFILLLSTPSPRLTSFSPPSSGVFDDFFLPPPGSPCVRPADATRKTNAESEPE